MTAFNVVRMRVKPGQEEAFLAIQRSEDMRPYKGLRAFHIISTGEREYVFLGEWDSMDTLVAARPAMIESLDVFREHLEDLGDGSGVTDARSGEAAISRRAD